MKEQMNGERLKNMQLIALIHILLSTYYVYGGTVLGAIFATEELTNSLRSRQVICRWVCFVK